ncbi:Gfo/Idh/MocA family oxidoreductase [bacterium]|nr:Gfo/Idh/MocA family oxidoreductase [bacterium]
MSQNGKIRTGVVGVGHLGSLHARIYSQMENAELVGVYDTDPQHAREVADRFGVRAFDSLEQLADSVEAASLAVPTDRHYELGRVLLERGLHLLIEKPVTETREQATELIDLARRSGKVLQVGHVERFNPALMAAVEHVHGSLFVESLRLAPFNPRGTEVDVVLDLMIHDIDIILSLLRRPVVEVAASGVPVLTDKLDIANARLTFEGGAVANITASRVSLEKVRKIRFFARDCYVSTDLLGRSATLYRKRSPDGAALAGSLTDRSAPPDMLELFERRALAVDATAEPLRLELESFIGCIGRGAHPVVSGEDGLQALEVAQRIRDAVRRSIELAGLAAADGPHSA